MTFNLINFGQITSVQWTFVHRTWNRINTNSVPESRALEPRKSVAVGHNIRPGQRSWARPARRLLLLRAKSLARASNFSEAAQKPPRVTD